MPVLRTIALLTCLLLSPALLQAADSRAHLLIEITGDGTVYVLQKWDGIEARERLVYNTGTEELGVLEAPVHEGHAELEYSSRELLRRDGDRLRLIIARLDNAGEWLDFDITLSYPANLEYINADPEPSFMNSTAHGLMWSIADERELILTASFRGQLNSDGRRRTGNAGTNGNSGSESHADDEQGKDPPGQGSAASRQRSDSPPASTSANDGSRMQRPGEDPEASGQSDRTADTNSPADDTSAPASSSGNPAGPSLPAGELLIDGDPLLLEFRMLINAARREGRADEDFLTALEKLLTKFFYLLDALEVTDEFEPSE